MCTRESKAHIFWAVKKKHAYYLKIPANGLQRQPWKADDRVRDKEKQPTAAGGGRGALATTSQRPVSTPDGQRKHYCQF